MAETAPLVVYVRELTPDDITDRYLSWFRDEEVTRFLEARDISREDALQHLREGEESGSYAMYAICDRANDLHIGNLKIGPMDHKHRVSDLVMVIGDRDYWGRGAATQAFVLGTGVAFDKFDMRKVRSSVYGENVASVRASIKGGFVVEAVLRGEFLVDGGTDDRVFISCFNPKYFDPDDD